MAISHNNPWEFGTSSTFNLSEFAFRTGRTGNDSDPGQVVDISPARLKQGQKHQAWQNQG